MKEKFSIKCVSVSPGLVAGKAKLLETPEDVLSIDSGDIIVLPKSHPMYALAVR